MRSSSTHVRMLAVATLLTGIVSCGGDPKPAAPAATQRQRDSAIAGSNLPGARGVGGAMAAQDSAARRRAVLDSIARADSQ